MTYATPADVAVRWAKELSPEEEALVSLRLAEVERLIRRRLPDLDLRAEDAGYAQDLVQVEADAVLRLARNPEGYMSETDGNYTYMLQQGRLSGRLYLTPEEWQTLGAHPRVLTLVPTLGGTA